MESYLLQSLLEVDSAKHLIESVREFLDHTLHLLNENYTTDTHRSLVVSEPCRNGLERGTADNIGSNKLLQTLCIYLCETEGVQKLLQDILSYSLLRNASSTRSGNHNQQIATGCLEQRQYTQCSNFVAYDSTSLRKCADLSAYGKRVANALLEQSVDVNDLHLCIGLYTFSLLHCSHSMDYQISVLLSNRSLVWMKLKRFRMALNDAAAAVAYCPSYKKGWYRCAVAASAFAQECSSEAQKSMLASLSKDAYLKTKASLIDESVSQEISRWMCCPCASLLSVKSCSNASGTLSTALHYDGTYGTGAYAQQFVNLGWPKAVNQTANHSTLIRSVRRTNASYVRDVKVAAESILDPKHASLQQDYQQRPFLVETAAAAYAYPLDCFSLLASHNMEMEVQKSLEDCRNTAYGLNPSGWVCSGCFLFIETAHMSPTETSLSCIRLTSPCLTCTRAIFCCNICRDNSFHALLCSRLAAPHPTPRSTEISTRQQPHNHNTSELILPVDYHYEECLANVLPDSRRFLALQLLLSANEHHQEGKQREEYSKSEEMDSSILSRRLEDLTFHLPTQAMVLTDWIINSLSIIGFLKIYSNNALSSETRPNNNSIILSAQNLQKVLTVFGQVCCNSFALNTYFNQKHLRYGSAVFYGASAFNHSCAPNCYVTFNGPIAEIRLIQSVTNNQQLFISYGPIAGKLNTEDRRKQLETSFQFICQCEICSTGGLSYNPQCLLESSNCLGSASSSQSLMGIVPSEFHWDMLSWIACPSCHSEAALKNYIEAESNKLSRNQCCHSLLLLKQLLLTANEATQSLRGNITAEDLINHRTLFQTSNQTLWPSAETVDKEQLIDTSLLALLGHSCRPIYCMPCTITSRSPHGNRHTPFPSSAVAYASATAISDHRVITYHCIRCGRQYPFTTLQEPIRKQIREFNQLQRADGINRDNQNAEAKEQHLLRLLKAFQLTNGLLSPLVANVLDQLACLYNNLGQTHHHAVKSWECLVLATWILAQNRPMGVDEPELILELSKCAELAGNCNRWEDAAALSTLSLIHACTYFGTSSNLTQSVGNTFDTLNHFLGPP